MQIDPLQPATSGAGEFEFLVPIEKGIVRDPATGELHVDGPISVPTKDLQGERVLFQAVAKGLDTFLRLGGPVDYDHRSVQRQTPKEFERDGAPVRFIVGQNAGIRKGRAQGHDVFYMRTRLMKGKRATADLMEHVNAGGKLFYSIGGVVTDRVETPGGPIIKGTKITHVALTPYPANPDCGVTPVGISGLQKSLAGPRLPSGRLGKTMTAGGEMSGLGSTGGRALVREDLEGAPTAPRKKCKGRTGCSCGCRKKAALRDTTDVTRGTTMEKNTLDSETLAELKALESDQHLGPIAKALAFLGISRPALKKSQDDDDNDDDSDPDGDEDGDGEDGDDEGEGQNPYGKMAGKFGKSANFSYYEPAPAAAADVDADEFAKSLLSAVGEMLHKHEMRVAKIVRTERQAMEKSLGAQVIETQTLQKGLSETLEQMGARPARPNPYRVQNGGPGAQPNAQRADRAFTLRTLEQMALAKSISFTDVTQFEISGELPPHLEQQVNTEFRKSLAH